MDKPRYPMMNNSIRGMILGKSERLPDETAPEIKEPAKEKGFEFTDAYPQSYYPDNLLVSRRKKKRTRYKTPAVSGPVKRPRYTDCG